MLVATWHVLGPSGSSMHSSPKKLPASSCVKNVTYFRGFQGVTALMFRFHFCERDFLKTFDDLKLTILSGVEIKAHLSVYLRNIHVPSDLASACR